MRQRLDFARSSCRGDDVGPPRLARHVEAEHDDTRRAESHDMHNFAMLKRVSGAPVGTGQRGLGEGHFGQDEVRDGQWSVQKYVTD